MDLAGGVGEAEGEEGQVRGLGPEPHAAGADGGEWSIGADVRAAGAEVAGQFARAGAGVVVGGVERETAGRPGEFAARVEGPASAVFSKSPTRLVVRPATGAVLNGLR